MLEERWLRVLACAAVLGVWAGGHVLGEGYSWQEPHARVLPTGDLEWAPKPFVFESGESVRYIDFEGGNDEADGTRAAPWKHHPWDKSATGKAKAYEGIHTYVFKRGVVYHGKLLANDRGKQSGEPGNPIRLTSDPSWGEGEAMLVGSLGIRDGWKKCTEADAPVKMPAKNNVWYIDLDKSFIPRGVWETYEGKSTRIPLARFPNWQDTNPLDPQVNWAQISRIIRTKKGDDGTLWDPKKDSPEEAGQYWLCDDKNLTNPDPEFYMGARLWGEWWGNMATPHISPNVVSKYNAKFHGINAFPCGYPAGGRTGNRFFLEGVPQFLDEPGEYYYERNGAHAGRLYVRLPQDRDPNRSVVHAGRRDYIVDIRHQHDIEITGLRFGFVNPPRGVFDRLPHPSFVWPRVSAHPSAVRIVGMCSDIKVANCRFKDVVCAVTGFTRPSPNNEIYFLRNEATDDDKLFAPPLGDVMDRITISDCDISDTDDSAILFRDGPTTGRPTPEGHVSDLRRLSILRNRLFRIGLRQYSSKEASIPSIGIHNVLQMEVAGNMLDRCGGAGIFIFGGKGANDLRVRPLIRILVHHNKVTNCLLSTNDYGGIEAWQGGPIYIYNNVVGNALGRRNYSWFDGGARTRKAWNWINWGHAYYCDGFYKSYQFNNIAWGMQSRLADSWGKTGTGDYEGTFLNMAAFIDVLGFMNHRFNNTAYRFAVGYHVAGGIHSRNSMLGNVFADIGGAYARESSNLGGAHGSISTAPQEVACNSYANNIFHGIEEGGWPELVGRGQWKGKKTVTLKDFQEKMATLKMRKSQAGWMSETMPLRNPANHDYRLTRGSVAIDRGVRFFVPWSLHGTVGEWNFYKHPADPGVVVGENFYMTDEYIARTMYHEVPWNDLQTNNVTLESYAAGPLENWTQGALTFDGKGTFCIMPDRMLKGDYERSQMPKTVTDDEGRKHERIVREKNLYPGSKRKTVDMGINNFLIEVYFKTKPGHTGGVLVSKAADAGYILDVDGQGRPRLTLRAGGKDLCSRSGATPVNDGKWHHVIAEVDRAPGQGITIYVDGEVDGRERGAPGVLGKDVSLSNTADFLVGKGTDGSYFAGMIDFLRVSRGTLADAKTTIKELYAWQFNGPQFRDFTGHAPTDGKRDAGALEAR